IPFQTRRLCVSAVYPKARHLCSPGRTYAAGALTPHLLRSLSSNRQNRSPPRRARKGSGRPDAERSPILEFCVLGSLRALSGFSEQPSSNTSRFLLPGFERRASRGRKDGCPSKLGVSASRRYIQKRVTFAHPAGHTPRGP